MNEEFDENVVSFFQRILPLVCSFFVVLLAYLPINFLFFNNIRPDYGYICIYFWMLHRPDLFNLTSVVLLGLFDMVLSGAFLGLSLFAYLVMYVLIYNTQRFFNAKPFIVMWYGFMALSLVAMLIKWLISSVYYGEFLPMSVLFFSYLIGAAIYPIISLILAFVQNVFIQDDGL